MQYNGRYNIFDPAEIKTYPLSRRKNKLDTSAILDPADILRQTYQVSPDTCRAINDIADNIIRCRGAGRPVILFTGAHLVKNGLSRLVIELLQHNLLTLVAGNGATAIHDFELALMGRTSEDVPNALEKGRFGMAYEFCYHNQAVSLGDKYKLGYGESLGRVICEESFFQEVLSFVGREDAPKKFENPQISILACCYEHKIPFTVHVGIGADVTDQHISFDARAKGGCSGRDFLIYADQVAKLTGGGVILNIGSAVTGPEVFLKAASMAANIGKTPDRIITADFDIRPFHPQQMTDESTPGYYFRDQKSIVTRIPQAFNGKGHYVRGNQKITIPLLYKAIIEKYREYENTIRKTDS